MIKIYNNIIKHILLIILILLVIFGFILWKNGGNIKWEDFGLNFFTEMVGVLVTVFIVDSFYKKREKMNKLPIRLMMYQELSLLHNRFVGFIFELYSKSVKDKPPRSMKDFFEKGYHNKAFLYTNLKAKPNISPSMTMIQYIIYNINDFESKASKIIDRYSYFLDTKISLNIYTFFIESPFISVGKQINSIYSSRSKLPYPESVFYYLFDITPKDIKIILSLNKWLEKERIELLKYYPDIRTISSPEYLSNIKDIKYDYGIEEKELLKQIDIFEKWRKEQNTN